jgi:hypothetical protein
MKPLSHIESIKVALQESIDAGEPSNEVNWENEIGVLLTQDEVKYLLSFIDIDGL